MIPNEQEIYAIWDTYALPLYKRIHCKKVADVAMMIAQHINAKGNYRVNEPLLFAAALLHDIDKHIEKIAQERHPDAAVRVLRKNGMNEVAEVIRTHPLHMIVDEKTAPKTIEQQLLFLADKMTKSTCIGVDERFALWKKEDIDELSQRILKDSYPKVISLRDSILADAGITEKELIKLL